MVKLYEDFVKFDKLHNIIRQLENRIKYWFSEGSLNKNSQLIDINTTLTNKYSTKRVMFNFNNEKYLYQCIISLSIENGDECQITIKRYDLENQKLIDSIQDEIDVNDVKEDYLISKISEFEEKTEDPDDNKIEIEKEKDEEEGEKGEEGGGEEDNEEEFQLGGAGEEEFDEEELDF